MASYSGAGCLKLVLATMRTLLSSYSMSKDVNIARLGLDKAAQAGDT